MADKFCLKKATWGSYVLTILSSLGLSVLAILFALWIPLIYLGLPITEQNINALTIYSVIVALMALSITFLLDAKNEKTFTILNSEIYCLNENIQKIDQNTQKIITQINHLEESQEITEHLNRIATPLEQMALRLDRIIDRPDQSREIVRQLDRIALLLEQMTPWLDRNREIIERLGRIESRLPAPESSQHSEGDSTAGHLTSEE